MSSTTSWRYVDTNWHMPSSHSLGILLHLHCFFLFSFFPILNCKIPKMPMTSVINPVSPLHPKEPPLLTVHQARWVPPTAEPTILLPVVWVTGISSTSPISAVSTRAPAVGTHLADGAHKGAHCSSKSKLTRCRFLTIFGVVGSLMGSILCFLQGSGYVVNSFVEYSPSGGKVIMLIIEAIDIYLLGTGMLVFGIGLYELFISNLDIAKTSSYGSNLLGLFKLSERPKWLEIQSVNELKTKLGHVIVMVLLVGMIEKIKKVTISSPGDLLCFAASILLSSGCLYLLSKLQSSKQSKHA